jgi:2-oxoglutarate ferredoxin oxidoreductase subunit beta
MAIQQRVVETSKPIENNVIVAGIGCSGNMVHLLEGPQPFGIHGIHGRTLPIAMGIKMSRPDLNVVVVAGDGDFLSIGAEHIGPQAQRNLNVCCVIMDNGVYGLTKGQTSPTTAFGTVTSTTPFGKIEQKLNPMELYLTYGVSFVASGYSSKVREMTDLIVKGMNHPGFAIVHIQSPCTTYNDTHDLLKGNPKENKEPLLYDIPAEHDPSDINAAYKIVRSPGVPQGIVYQNPKSVPFDQRFADMAAKVKPRTAAEQMATFKI